MQKRAFIIFLFGINFLLGAQTTVLTSSSLPAEHVNLVLDRDLYLSGETIWFKAMVNMENDSEAISKILYIELFNSSQKSIVKKKFEIKNALVSGEFEIPSEFLSEVYFLRAYTNYNKNFPSHSWFYTAIQVINPRKGLTADLNEVRNELVIFQKPQTEKGLITIYYILPANFNPPKAQVLLMANNQVLKEGFTLSNAWGKLDFHPIDSLKYKLAFTNSLGDTIVKDLPSPKLFPHISDLQSNDQQILVINKGSNQLNAASIVLADNYFQEISTTDFNFFEDVIARFNIPDKDILYPGLYFVLLKSPKGKILAIHSIVSDGGSKNDTIIDVIEQKTFKQRQKVSVNLENIDLANMSTLAVKVIASGTQMSTIQKLAQCSQDPHLFLSYLRTQFSPQTLAAEELDICLNIIDNVLNTPIYFDLLAQKPVNDLNWIPEIRDIALSGILIDKHTQKPVADIPVYLSVFQDHPQIHIYDTRTDGSFLFSINNFENNQDIFLCPLINNGRDLELKINTDFSPIFPKLNEIPLSIDSSYTRLLEQLNIAFQTNNRYQIEVKKRDSSLKHLPYSFANPDISIVLDDYIETPTLEMVFKELVPSLGVRKKNGVYSLRLYDPERELFYESPLILVDNIPIFDVNELLKVSPKIVEKIELHPTTFILGDHNINGIVMLSTTTDNFGGIIMPKSSTFLEYQTLNPGYVFNTKTYTSPEELQSRAGDFRTVLHWEPLIEKNNETELNFYTSDQTTSYEAIVFGTYKNGQAFQYKLFNLNVID